MAAKQKKIAIINDLSGFGRCSLSVQIPVISALGVQACPVPTGIFSNHTGYPDYAKKDLTGFMPEYLKKWKKLGLKFDGIYIGYLTSSSQINIIKRFIKDFSDKNTVVVLDPVMGDDGRLYSGYKKSTAKALKELVGLADIITPNATECCFLTDMEYKEKRNEAEWADIAGRLSVSGAQKVVITGINMGSMIGNVCFEKKNKKAGVSIVRKKSAGKTRPGTGDIFSAIMAADAVNKEDFLTSIKKASDFIAKCIVKSDELKIPLSDGVCFEEFLSLKN